MSESNSSSDSSQTQLQESQDNRISGGTGSVNLVASRSSVGGSVNISTTDFGSVSKSFDFAQAIAQGAANTAAASAGQVQAIAKDAMSSVKDAYGESTKSAISSVKEAYSNSSDTLAAAYSTAKAGEQKVMVAVGLAIVGVVAIKALGKA